MRLAALLALFACTGTLGLVAPAAPLALPVPLPVPEPDLAAVCMTMPGACASAGPGGAACVATPVLVLGAPVQGGPLAEAAAGPGLAATQRAALADVAQPGVAARASAASCEAEGAFPPRACGVAEAGSVEVEARGWRVLAHGLRTVACAEGRQGSATGGTATVAVQGPGVDVVLPVVPDQPTAVPLGPDAWVALNVARRDLGEACADTQGAALLLHLPGLDVIAGWASVQTCRQPATLALRTDPAGSAPPSWDARAIATVTGPGPATGGVEFVLCGVTQVTTQGCPEPRGTDLGVADLVGGEAVSPPTGIGIPGPYCFRARYTGDENYLPGTYTDRSAACLQSEKQPVRMTGQATLAGTTLRDSVTLEGDWGPVGGFVQFALCTPAQVAANGGACTSGGTLFGTKSISGGAAQSNPATATGPGTWCWRATFAGSGTYALTAHTDPARQCVTVG